MKVLLLSNKVPYPANDGSSIAIASSVDMLLEHKVETHLLSLNTKKHFKPTPKIEAEKPRDVHFHALEVNTNITPFNAALNLVNGKAFHVSRFLVKEFSRLLEAYLEKHQFNWIQIEGLPMAVYLPLIKQHSSAKISLRAHNVEHQIWERHAANEKNVLKKRYIALQAKRLKTYELEVLQQVNALLTITQEDADSFKALGIKTDSLHLPCGINPAKYERQESHESETFDAVSLSSMDWLPNVQGAEWFIDKVWPLITEIRPQTTICLAGRDMPKHLLQKSSENLKIKGMVTNMNTFVTNAKICLVPLLAGSGMRIKVLENLALGKCIVATSVGAEGFPLTDDVEIKLADDPQHFAKAVCNLLDDADARDEMGTNAQSFAFEHFSNRNLGNKLLQFYLSV